MKQFHLDISKIRIYSSEFMGIFRIHVLYPVAIPDGFHRITTFDGIECSLRIFGNTKVYGRNGEEMYEHYFTEGKFNVRFEDPELARKSHAAAVRVHELIDKM